MHIHALAFELANGTEPKRKEVRNWAFYFTDKNGAKIDSGTSDGIFWYPNCEFRFAIQVARQDANTLHAEAIHVLP